jgi:uncharacterized protein YlzI (FlbEa/FlbD family)
MNAFVLIALDMLIVQTLDGREVHINPAHIVSVSETSETRDPREKLVTEKAHCVIILSNGSRVSVAEHCDSVRQRLAK